MRIRTGHSPDAWTPNEPAAPYSPRSYGGAVAAVTIAQMRPVLSSNGGNFITANSGLKVQPAISIRLENRREVARCGVLMPLVGERCHRTYGHRDVHRTAEWMAREALNRSTRKVWEW